MRKLFLAVLLLAVLGALVVYGHWTRQRPEAHYLSDLRVGVSLNVGQPGERGNLLGIEPQLFPGDYQDLHRLHLKLAAYLDQARSIGLIGPRTVVVLPEHIGSWLWLRGEKNELFQTTHLENAQHWLMASNPLEFLLALVQSQGKSRLTDIRLRMKAQAMADDYQQLFAGLARDYGVTLVAGSIVLPAPHLENGLLKVGGGPLFNASLVFGPDGAPLGAPQRQLHPGAELDYTVQGASADSLHVVNTPAGRLGVLIGQDSWYPSSYSALHQQQVDLVAIPASLPGKGAWSRQWTGLPEAAPRLETSNLSAGEAWQRLPLASQPPLGGARAGLSVFLQGRFFEQIEDGKGFALHDGQVMPSTPGSSARLLNVWL